MPIKLHFGHTKVNKSPTNSKKKKQKKTISNEIYHTSQTTDSLLAKHMKWKKKKTFWKQEKKSGKS